MSVTSEVEKIVGDNEFQSPLPLNNDDDDIPSSAVDLQIQTRLSTKLENQLKVEKATKLYLDPHYKRKHVTKEEYKKILRRVVPKISKRKSEVINYSKIKDLVDEYVKISQRKNRSISTDQQ